jgi:OFA family oxalate/formate antiporter-like MFS transporter
VNNRWFQLCASLITMIMIANLQYAWTLFVEPIRAARGWALADIQFAFTLFILAQTWVQPLDGWLIDRLGPRGFISAAGVLCGLGWAGLGHATSLPMVYACYALAGIGAAFVYSASIGSALKWFSRRRGLASGVMAAGFGGGTALFIPIISWLIASYGYAWAFVTTGLVQGATILVVAQFLRHPPDGPSEPSRTTGSSTVGERPFTTPAMLRTARFYLLYAMFVLMAAGGLLVTANAGPIARSWGLTTATLTLAATISPIANALGRVFWGWASDRIGREITMVVAFALHALSLMAVLSAGPQSASWFVLTLSFVYFTWGEIFSLFPSAAADYFGTRHATSNYSVLYTAKGLAAILGGWFAAWLYQSSGAWTAGFYGSAAMAVAATALAVRLYAVTRGAPALGPTMRV